MKKKRTTTASKKVKTYCVCQCDGTDGRFMVACDGCNNWFHPSCIGTTKQEVEKIKNFYCPKCREERSGAPSASTSTSGSDVKANPDAGKLSKPLNDVIGDATLSEKIEAAFFAKYAHGTPDYKQYLHRATNFLRELVKKKHTVYRAQFKDKVLSGAYTPESLVAAPESPLFGSLDDVDDDVISAATAAATTTAAAAASPVPLKRACLDFSKCPNSEIAWKGTIQKNNKSNFGTFKVSGRLVFGGADVIDLLPDTIEFAGRLITKKLCQYLHQLHRSKSRKFSVLRIDPENDADVDCFGNVFEYFTARKRSGSLQALNKVVPPEEMYLLPLLPNEGLPLFLAESQGTDADVVNFEAGLPRLFLIVVAKIEHFKKDNVEEVKKENSEEKKEEKEEEAKKDNAEEVKKENDKKMEVEEEKKEEEEEKVEEVKKEKEEEVKREKEEEVKKDLEEEVKKSEEKDKKEEEDVDMKVAEETTETNKTETETTEKKEEEEKEEKKEEEVVEETTEKQSTSTPQEIPAVEKKD